MKQLLKAAWLIHLALTGSMLIAQNDPHAQPPPAEGQTQQNSQQTVSRKIAKSDDGKYVLVDSAETMYQLVTRVEQKRLLGRRSRFREQWTLRATLSM
jgi:hypothetical protein